MSLRPVMRPWQNNFEEPETNPRIGALRIACVTFSRIYHTLDVQTPCPLPRKGPGLLVCNHISGLDPVMIQSVCPRVVVWMMAEEYGRISALRPVFKAIRIILVERRGRDTAALREGMRALEAGKILGVFPEGRISPNHDMLPFHTGVAMMAARSKVPIYPAYIEGTQRGKEMGEAFSRRQHATLRFGQAFHLKDPVKGEGDRLAQATGQIRREIEALRDLMAEQKRRIYD